MSSSWSYSSQKIILGQRNTSYCEPESKSVLRKWIRTHQAIEYGSGSKTLFSPSSLYNHCSQSYWKHEWVHLSHTSMFTSSQIYFEIFPINKFCLTGNSFLLVGIGRTDKRTALIGQHNVALNALSESLLIRNGEDWSGLKSSAPKKRDLINRRQSLRFPIGQHNLSGMIPIGQNNSPSQIWHWKLGIKMQGAGFPIQLIGRSTFQSEEPY